eukprot:GHVP01064772.1.p1 GENE.GHVP01064772.1~~GHVP01064772.1.p1  ORF type:complete len:244 (-),score=37.54 GHVP01064772.1:168-899(-)
MTLEAGLLKLSEDLGDVFVLPSGHTVENNDELKQNFSAAEISFQMGQCLAKNPFDASLKHSLRSGSAESLILRRNHHPIPKSNSGFPLCVHFGGIDNSEDDSYAVSQEPTEGEIINEKEFRRTVMLLFGDKKGLRHIPAIYDDYRKISAEEEKTTDDKYFEFNNKKLDYMSLQETRDGFLQINLFKESVKSKDGSANALPSADTGRLRMTAEEGQDIVKFKGRSMTKHEVFLKLQEWWNSFQF